MHESITAEQAVAVRRTEMRCLGPKNQDLARIVRPLLRGRAALADDDPRRAPLAAVGAAGIETTDGALSFLLLESATEEWRAAARLLNASSRGGCGYDFTLTVLSHPLDGQEYEYKCPRCGVTGWYRAPMMAAAP